MGAVRGESAAAPVRHGASEGGSPGGPVQGVDGEFVRRLHLGSDHLAAGDVEAALVEMEQAVALHPKDAKARGLLALCLFKLGKLDRAEEVYRDLVRENPFDVTLHVNLGLVQLKSGQHDAAIRTLEVATGLAPEHRRAQNYLGLAYAQSGNYEKAREAFVQAGSAAKAREMERALAALWAKEDPAQRKVPTEPFMKRPELVGETPPSGEEGQEPAAEVPSMAELTRENRLFWPRGAPFAIDKDVCSVDFSAGIHTRVDGLIAARGDTSWRPMQKRFGGRLIDRPFGSGTRQMWHASGGGQLLIAANHGGVERVFSAVRLEEDAYVVEERLFAFEESVDVENGRVPGQGLDLPLVRLRGQGHLLLVTSRTLRSEPIFGNESLRVPLEGLAAWTGPLTPRLIAMFPGSEGAWVELTGEGDVLLLS